MDLIVTLASKQTWGGVKCGGVTVNLDCLKLSSLAPSSKSSVK